jgi:hypothetical protein
MFLLSNSIYSVNKEISQFPSTHSAFGLVRLYHSVSILIMKIFSTDGTGLSRCGRRESDERSCLSLRIKHSESYLPPTGPAQRVTEDLQL